MGAGRVQDARRGGRTGRARPPHPGHDGATNEARAAQVLRRGGEQDEAQRVVPQVHRRAHQGRPGRGAQAHRGTRDGSEEIRRGHARLAAPGRRRREGARDRAARDGRRPGRWNGRGEEGAQGGGAQGCRRGGGCEPRGRAGPDPGRRVQALQGEAGAGAQRVPVGAGGVPAGQSVGLLQGDARCDRGQGCLARGDRGGVQGFGGANLRGSNIATRG